MALAARLRLSRLDVGRVLRAGRRFFSPLGHVSARRSAVGHGRIAFSISAKVSKKSSERNRIRRALNFWAEKSDFSRISKEDVVVFVSPAAGRKTKKELAFLTEKMLKGLTQATK